MCSVRADMAITSFVAVAEREKGLPGRGSLVTVGGEWDRWWTCSVESQAAEIRMLHSLLYSTALTPAACVDNIVCSPLRRSILTPPQKQY